MLRGIRKYLKIDKSKYNQFIYTETVPYEEFNHTIPDDIMRVRVEEFFWRAYQAWERETQDEDIKFKTYDISVVPNIEDDKEEETLKAVIFYENTPIPLSELRKRQSESNRDF